MNIDKLSKRLDCVASYIVPGMTIADIGSDHAYLPCYAIKQGLAHHAIAGEVVQGPYEAAQQQVLASELTDSIEVRKGNGLEVIKAGEVDCIIIAGMGGALISDILEKGKEKLEGVKRLILQPNLAAINIRSWMLDNNWQLIDEEILMEDGKIYEILVAERGNPQKPYQNIKSELLLGPFLLKKKNETFRSKWNHELRQWENILLQLSKSEKAEARKKDLVEKIKIVKEALL